MLGPMRQGCSRKGPKRITSACFQGARRASQASRVAVRPAASGAAQKAVAAAAAALVSSEKRW